ncbi:uncharacterized protein PRCAT00006151001 [Priceomyces carsonii]|uniref:uncharacterized protein n=1 Tax=Priceomyces carsonii TaxID=28549 RepID=UPI002ED8B7C6|nr:unnamed protein product [Priceomyces carsonii]
MSIFLAIRLQGRYLFRSQSVPFVNIASKRLTSTINMMKEVKEPITLNETELSIRDLLVEFCNKYNNQNKTNNLVLRITGGWVRDKLLGKESNDLDIAINEMLGEEFASKLHEYVNKERPELLMKATHLIKKNPEKSKHLETCTTKLFGLDIDFVNLRCEHYTADSRVPIIECGTAEEDALRRDATLNALFYNLNESKIEDFTGFGKEDLKNGILRTPLQPLKTFLDDPLRVLRLIRFASRFNFIIEKETLAAMANPGIKDALIHKISRERVGVELDKILSGPNPKYGLNLISYVKLSESVFSFGTLTETISKINDQHVLNELEVTLKNLSIHIRNTTNLSNAFEEILQSDERFPRFSALYHDIMSHTKSQKLFWLSAILEKYGAIRIVSNPKRKHILNSAPELFIKEGLRFGKGDFDPVSTILQEHNDSKELMNQALHNPESVERSKLGLYLRKFGSYLNLDIVCNCFIDVLESISQPESSYDEVPQPIEKSQSEYNSEIIPFIKGYDSLLDRIYSLDLSNVSELKPLIDGKTLSTKLQMKPGPWTGKITTEILIWQLDNPQGSQEECLDYIKLIIHNYIV